MKSLAILSVLFAANESAHRFLKPEWVMVWVTIAYVLIAAFTLFAISRQGNFMQQQASTANRALIAQFRPRVIVRRIDLIRNDSHSVGQHGENMFTIESWTIELLFVNTGGTGASVHNGFMEAGWREVPERHRYERLHLAPIDSFSLKPGEEKSVTVLISERGKFGSKVDFLRLKAKDRGFAGHRLQAVGLICYTDESGISRKTGFSRDLDIEAMKFVASKDPEEEYED